MDTEEIKWVNVSELAFDLKNPRLVEFEEVESATDEEVIQIGYTLRQPPSGYNKSARWQVGHSGVDSVYRQLARAIHCVWPMQDRNHL